MPTWRAPRSAAVPLPGFHPPTTSSCSGRIFTFCQAARPDTGEVEAVALLGHDPLEAARLGGLVERDTVGLDVVRQAHPRVLAQDAFQERLALVEGQRGERAPVQPEEIEDLVDEPTDRRTLDLAPPDALLEQREIWLAIGSERDHLAVDDRLPRVDPRWRRRGMARSIPRRPSGRGSTGAPRRPRTTASTRKPSHLISNSQSGSSKGAATRVASMGSTNSGIVLSSCRSASRAQLVMTSAVLLRSVDGRADVVRDAHVRRAPA